jgi:hypothetical protein
VEQLSNQLPSSVVKKIKNSKIVNCNISGTNIVVEYKLANNSKESYVIVKSMLGQIEKKICLSKNTNCLTEDISDLKSGLHVVVLVADGIHCDSKLMSLTKK